MECGAASKEERDSWVAAIEKAVHAEKHVPVSPASPAGQETVFGRKVTKDDFELEGVIGQGSFAKVLQVKAKAPPHTTYAMKVLKKKTVPYSGITLSRT